MFGLAESFRSCKPERLLVAYSGGLDSTALLILARRYAGDAGLPIRALHFNHRVHSESDQWERHCATVCGKLGISFEIGRLGESESLPARASEGALRRYRYAFFESLMSAGDVLLTGHHREDVAETLLLNLMRGSGLRGLAAVPAQRSLGAGLVVRPLLALSRGDLLEVVDEAGLQWIEDSSNLQLQARRNFIRHRVMPLLNERWPGAAATLSRAAQLSREAADLLDETLAKDLDRLTTGDPQVLALQKLQRFQASRQRAILRLWLRRLGVPPLPRARLKELVRQLLCAGPDRQPCTAFGSLQIRRYRQSLYALGPVPAIDPDTVLQWRQERLELPAGAGLLEWRRRDDGTPFSGPLPHLQVRFGSGKKSLKPSGQRHHRPLRLLFQEAGLPPWDRPRCPLIYSHETLIGVGDICWSEELERIQQSLGTGYRWRRLPALDPTRPLG